jgi:single-strand DNA-binding protein
MANGNTVTIIGNVTREPELRFTPSGQANTRFGVAVNRRWQDRSSGEWQEATSFFDVVCWRELAENVSESLPKGARVLVTGRLEQRTYEPREGGDKRSVVEIIADEVGPSLRWATAEVKKNDRRSGDSGGGGGGGGGGSRPAPRDEPSSDDFGEEPF